MEAVFSVLFYCLLVALTLAGAFALLPLVVCFGLSNWRRLRKEMRK